MLITRANTWHSPYRKRTINSEIKLGPVSLKFVTVILIAIAALFYLSQSSQAAILKYKVMDLEDQKSKAQTDVKQLEVESARLKSLNEIKNNAERLNLEQ